MYHLMYWSCWFAALLINKQRVIKHHTEFRDREVIKTVEVEVIRHDPNGLVKRDIEQIATHVTTAGYQKGDTLADVAYKQGQNDVLRFLQKKFLGG